MWIKDILLKRDGKSLIAGGDLPMEPGRITVIFGASGCGKSTLLYALAELDDAVEFSSSAGARPLAAERIGLVPQQAALFEDLRDAYANIAFAHAHSPEADPARLQEILDHAGEKLGIREDWHLPLSGGQRQRVALARALAGRSSVLLCDEPTSGLDPASRNEAIEAIRCTARDGVSVIVVTHDLEWNRTDVADHAVILRSKRLSYHNPGHPLDAGCFKVGAITGQDETEPAFGAPLLDLAEQVGRSAWWLLLFPFQIMRGLAGPRRVPLEWLYFHVRHFSRMVLGLSSLTYLASGGALVGFASSFFLLGALEKSPHLRTILYPELLAGGALGLYRLLIPLITALLVAAKCGSAMAADIGNRQYGGQIAVMRLLGANPETHLLFSAMLALAVGLPLLNLLAFGAASLGSLFGFLLQFPGETTYAWRMDFLRLLQRHGQGVWLDGTGWMLAKLSIAGAGIGMIAYRAGTAAKTGNTDVGRDISRATLWASLWCLAVFTVFAFFEFS